MKESELLWACSIATRAHDLQRELVSLVQTLTGDAAEERAVALVLAARAAYARAEACAPTPSPGELTGQLRTLAAALRQVLGPMAGEAFDRGFHAGLAVMTRPNSTTGNGPSN